MAIKLIGLLIVVAALLSVALYRTAPRFQPQTQDMPPKNQVRWRPERAKAEGHKRIQIEPPIIDYLGSEVSDLDEALGSYTVVVATAIEQRTYEHVNDLITWTKFKTEEELSPLRPPLCPTCNSHTQPEDMLPLNPGEFLTATIGGSKVIEGVEINELNPAFPQFQMNQKYVLLISVYANQTAVTLGGPIGVFKAGPGDIFLPVSQKNHPLREEIQKKLGNSLPLLKTRVKHLPTRS